MRRSVTGPLIACQNAIHACTLERLPQWLGPAIWEIALEEPEEAGGETIARAGTLVRRVEGWNEQTARFYASDCASRVLPLPKDVHCLNAYASALIGAAAWAAVRAAEIRWQSQRLGQYLRGEVDLNAYRAVLKRDIARAEQSRARP